MEGRGSLGATAERRLVSPSAVCIRCSTAPTLTLEERLTLPRPGPPSTLRSLLSSWMLRCAKPVGGLGWWVQVPAIGGRPMVILALGRGMAAD